MTKEHPITPPPKLVHQWINEATEPFYVPTQAARWGADQELEACCEWLEDADLDDSQKVSWVNLRAARRPKPPSLKEQSIALIDKIQGNKEMWDIRDLDVIRQALESLPD